MAIDLAVGRAITTIRALERAVHDHGSWTMRLCGITVLANRNITDNGVEFSATFPAMESTDQEHPIALACDGDVVRMRGMLVPEHPFLVRWDLDLVAGVVV